MDEQPPISSEPADRGMELTDEDPPLAAGEDFEPGAPRADVAKGSPMRRRPGDRKWLVSAGTSVAIHAAVIGAAVTGAGAGGKIA